MTLAQPQTGNSVETPLLEFRNISKSFGAVKALRDVSFDLLPGEVHALLGQNGAGKSTLIKILAGVQAKDGGIIRVNGEESDFRTPAGARGAGIAVVYQELSLVSGHVGGRQHVPVALAEALWSRRPGAHPARGENFP